MSAVLIGLAHLVDLERIAESFSSDLPLRRIPWREDYFGLCLMTDALWTLPWTTSWPRLTTHVVTTVAIAVLLPAGYVFTTIGPSEQPEEPFIIATSGAGPERGDEDQVLYTTLNVADPDCQAAARAAAEQLLVLPEDNGIVEDMAIYFINSLEAARRYELDHALTTLWVDEDGTPDRWLDGWGDCSSDHVTFSEHFEAAFRKQSRGLPLDLQGYLAARAVCTDVELPEERDKRYLAEYRCYDLGAELEYLGQDYAGSQFDEVLSAAP